MGEATGEGGITGENVKKIEGSLPKPELKKVGSSEHEPKTQADLKKPGGLGAEYPELKDMLSAGGADGDDGRIKHYIDLAYKREFPEEGALTDAEKAELHSLEDGVEFINLQSEDIFIRDRKLFVDALKTNGKLLSASIELHGRGLSKESVIRIVLAKEDIDILGARWEGAKAFHEFYQGVIKSAARNEELRGKSFLEFLGNFHLGKRIADTITKFEKQGIEASKVDTIITNSKDVFDLVRWLNFPDGELKSFVEMEEGFQEVKNLLRRHGVSEDALQAISLKDMAGFTSAARPTAKLSYEANKKFFKPVFGIDDEAYSGSLLRLAINTQDSRDLLFSLRQIVAVAEELRQAGISRELVISWAGSGNYKSLQDFLSLASKKASLVAEHVAEPVPELQKFFKEQMPVGSEYYAITLPEKYAAYSESQIIASLPDHVSKSVRFFDRARGESLKGPAANAEMSVYVSDRIYDKYLFRGDTVNLYGRADTGFKGAYTVRRMSDIFDIFVSQKGVGHKATDARHSGTFVVDLPDDAYAFGGDEFALWVIRKNALSEVPLRIETENPFYRGVYSNEIEFADAIPMKHVEYLIVNPKTRDAILAKYGAENTEIFGRTLKDVILAGKVPNFNLVLKRLMIPEQDIKIHGVEPA